MQLVPGPVDVRVSERLDVPPDAPLADGPPVLLAAASVDRVGLAVEVLEDGVRPSQELLVHEVVHPAARSRRW